MSCNTDTFNEDFDFFFEFKGVQRYISILKLEVEELDPKYAGVGIWGARAMCL